MANVEWKGLKAKIIVLKWNEKRRWGSPGLTYINLNRIAIQTTDIAHSTVEGHKRGSGKNMDLNNNTN